MTGCAAASYVQGHAPVRLVVQLEPRRTVQYRPATGNLHAVHATVRGDSALLFWRPCTAGRLDWSACSHVGARADSR